MEDLFISIKCKKCGQIDKFPSNQFAITEDGRQNYLCSSCRETVVENRVQRNQIGNKQLLTED